MDPRGLERVTVAPGSTAPDASETVPPIAPTPCAAAGSEEHIQNDNTTMLLPTKSLALIVIPLFGVAGQGFQCDSPDHRKHTPPPHNDRFVLFEYFVFFVGVALLCADGRKEREGFSRAVKYR